ncbi:MULTISPECIES: pore-forming ESAT-6 family protein [Nocardiopsis]|uniref:pore-forming ESAT-6 family protein n=1 Tax=Nocardiopsis TaxID=2013 RepID=UPI0003481A41|nr:MULTISPECIES: pore-forming ESAT-6 family protein [Nocardiopsis]
MSGNGRNSYDMGASAEAQGNIHAVMSRLEQIIGDRDTDVSNAMADFEATGVSDEYSAKELKWHNAANEVREIIRLVRTTLEENDGTAQNALSRANSAVQSI